LSSGLATDSVVSDILSVPFAISEVSAAAIELKLKSAIKKIDNKRKNLLFTFKFIFLPPIIRFDLKNIYYKG